MERDDDLKGEGNSYTTELRILDTRLGKWLSLDPMMAKFPWQSPYVSMDNNPISLTDPYGGETNDWFKNQNGEMQYDARVTDQESLEALGYKGTYEGKAGWIHDEDNGIMHSYGSDGQQGQYKVPKETNTSSGWTFPQHKKSIREISDIYGPGLNKFANVAEYTTYGVLAFPAVMAIGMELGGGWILKEAGEYAFEEVTGIPIIISPFDVVEYTAKKSAKLGLYTVYHGIDDAGIVRYVGITKRNPTVRFGEHLNSFGTGKELLKYRAIDGAKDLSKIQARSWEQTLINQYGLGKNGGQLLNKINSIDPKYWFQYGIKP